MSNDDFYRRPLKVTYLVVGLLFVGIAGIWLLGATSTVDSNEIALWAPALLIVAGTVGLVGSFANNTVAGRRRVATTWAADTHTDRHPDEPTTILEEEHHD